MRRAALVALAVVAVLAVAVGSVGLAGASENPGTDEEVLVHLVDDGSNEVDATETIALFEDRVPPEYTVEYIDADSIDEGDIEETDIFVVYNADVFSFAGEELITTVEDDPTTGAVYLDQHGVTTVAGIPDRIDAVGDPEEFDSDAFGDGPAEYVIEAEHPLFDGVGDPEDVVDINSGGEISWFTGASGDTLATMQNQDEDGGPAAAVDPESGSVLLSGIAVGGFVDPGEPTDDAGEILANAVEFAEPQPEDEFFEVTDLDAPREADPGATIDVSATVTNVGDATGTQDVDFVFDGETELTEPVELEPDESVTVDFAGIQLPEESGVFEHGVATEDDAETAFIGVGVELVDVTVVESEDDTAGAETLGLFAEELPETHITQVLDSTDVTDAVVAETDVFVFHDFQGGPDDVETGEATGTERTDRRTDLDTGFQDLVETVENDTTIGAVYLDQQGSTSNAIPARTAAIDDPASTFESNDGDLPVSYDVQVDHPIFTGVADAGETVPIHEDPIFAARTWFLGASGETLAEVGAADDTAGGPAVAVDPESRSVLLSSIAVGTFVDDPGAFTAAANRTLANAVEFAEPGPFFAVSDLDAPAEAAPGGEIDVTATVTNLGDEAGTQAVDLVFDGETVATEDSVTLDPDETTAVTFENIGLPEESGVFEHGVFTEDDEATAEITVGEAFFAVSELDAPEEAEVGSQVDVTATVTNTGLVTGTQAVDFVFDGEVAATAENVTLDPDEATTVTFEDIGLPEESGVFEHGVFTDGDEATATITLGDVFFAVSDLDAPAEALPGSTLDVTATVTNTGNVTGTRDIEFVLDGEVAATAEGLELGAGENTTVGFEPTLPDEPGVFEHGVFTGDDNQTAEITVGEAFFAVSDLDAPAVAEPDSEVNVTATITNTGNVTGTQDVEFVFDGAVAATVESLELGVGENSTVTFENVGLPATLGVFEHGVFTADDNQTAEITVSEDINGNGNPATDTTGDGLLNDLTGDGEFDITDVQVLFENFDGEVIQANVGLFDFLGDDRVTIFDVQALFNQLQTE